MFIEANFTPKMNLDTREYNENNNFDQGRPRSSLIHEWYGTCTRMHWYHTGV